jgi:hypothetical protein
MFALDCDVVQRVFDIDSQEHLLHGNHVLLLQQKDEWIFSLHFSVFLEFPDPRCDVRAMALTSSMRCTSSSPSSFADNSSVQVVIPPSLLLKNFLLNRFHKMSREEGATSQTKGVTFPVPSEDLSIERVREVITDSCAITNGRLTNSCRLRYGNSDDMPKLLSLLASKSRDADTLIKDGDLFHSVVVEGSSKLVGFAVVYWAYSTWEGRHLYVNTIVAPSDTVETSLIYTLADVAVRLEGQRLVWQVSSILNIDFYIVFLATLPLTQDV